MPCVHHNLQKRALSVRSTKPNRTHAKSNLLLDFMGATRNGGVLQQVEVLLLVMSSTEQLAVSWVRPSSAPRDTRRATHVPQSLQPATYHNPVRRAQRNREDKTRRTLKMPYVPRAYTPRRAYSLLRTTSRQEPSVRAHPHSIPYVPNTALSDVGG